MHNGPLFLHLFHPKLNARAGLRATAWWGLPLMMLLLLLSAAATPSWAAAPRTATLARCSWDSPGTNPYRGELAAAVDHYTDIPAPTRVALKRRIASQAYDDIAVIGRSHITGGQKYKTELRDMHFGNGRLCRTVTRQRWAAGAEERGLVYCEGGHCVIVPTVCRNVSRVSRLPAGAAPSADVGSNSGAGNSTVSSTTQATPATGPVAVLAPENTELQFDAPSAGRVLSTGSDALPWTGPPAMTLMGAASDAGLAPAPQRTAPEAAAVLAPLVAALAPPAPVDLNGNGSFGGPLTAPAAAAGPAASTAPPLPFSPLLPPLGNGGGLVINLPAAPAAPVPEPGSAALMGAGLAVLARCVVILRRQRSAA